MKYILFLAFEYKHYKKPATIELFADDLLIDSIELKESIRRKDGEWKHPYETPEYDPVPKQRSTQGGGNGQAHTNQFEFRDEKYKRWIHWVNKWSVCEKFFTFEIDESVLKNKLTLNVINNSNNYTNGFMTKFSWFKFDIVGLIPKKYFDNIDLVDKELPDVLGSGHGRSSPYDMDAVQEWFWPNQTNPGKYDPDKDEWVQNGYDDFISNVLTMGDNFKYDFDLGTWNGMKVIKSKNVSDRFLNELYCIMDPVFLTYMLAAGLNK